MQRAKFASWRRCCRTRCRWWPRARPLAQTLPRRRHPCAGASVPAPDVKGTRRRRGRGEARAQGSAGTGVLERRGTAGKPVSPGPKHNISPSFVQCSHLVVRVRHALNEATNVHSRPCSHTLKIKRANNHPFLLVRLHNSTLMWNPSVGISALFSCTVNQFI